jgi:hypothetical protein
VHAELLDSAVKLACSDNGGRPPTQTDLRRALSTAYYASFHFVVAQCADLLTCDPGGKALGRAWRQVYQSVKHIDVRNACNVAADPSYGFPTEVQAFAVLYPNMRRLREEADYDPGTKRVFNSQHVMAKISDVDFAVQQFSLVKEADRRAFAILVAVKRRQSDQRHPPSGDHRS